MKTNALDRMILAMAPGWGVQRIRSRAVASTLLRHYEAAAPGRRTAGWRGSHADANVAAAPALAWLRAHSHDLIRNNSWAANGVGVIVDNVVGWGIAPKPVGAGEAATEIGALWNQWAETTQCDSDGRLTFSGLEALAARTVVESGEALVRRRPRRMEDGLAIPMQLQVLEPDFIDTSRDGTIGQEGGPIVQGVEFDAIGRRVAYWLFQEHPGSNRSISVSRRVSAANVMHLYRLDRPGQVRGVPWLCTAIVNLKDFDEFEDAQLMRQKIAACFAAFVTDADGSGAGIGEASPTEPLVEMIEPGLVNHLPPGREITFGNPPLVTDDGFSTRTLRRIAAGLRVTYEDLTGDYSQVNFSSARMARIKHYAAIHGWRWNMLIPHFCDGAWAWAMEAAVVAGLAPQVVRAEWTPPPMPMIEPDKEGLAGQRLVRGGMRTPSELVREQGYDPEAFWAEYAEDLAKLDALGIKLDSDVRAVSQAGLTQERVGAAGKAASAGAAAAEE